MLYQTVTLPLDINDTLAGQINWPWVGLKEPRHESPRATRSPYLGALNVTRLGGGRDNYASRFDKKYNGVSFSRKFTHHSVFINSTQKEPSLLFAKAN